MVYLGDDQTNEYIYRYVSNAPWQQTIDAGGSPLDDGILYVAKFNADGSGSWLPLTTANPALSGFATQADILINTRAAADAAGATRMDRPEWIDVLRSKKEVYVTLTNNSGRGNGTNPPVDAANPRASNVYGHIVRWRYAGDFSDPTFTWDIFALAGDPATPAHGSEVHLWSRSGLLIVRVGARDRGGGGRSSATLGRRGTLGGAQMPGMGNTS